jgi:hypothetical protein
MRDISRYAFTVLTMRANTPPGEWVGDDEAFARIYESGWREIVERHQGNSPEEYLFLDMLNMANYFLGMLTEITGKPKELFLDAVRRDYVDPDEAQS